MRPVATTPDTVALTLEVVLVNTPGGAPAGTCSVTEKVQLSPGASVPPASVSSEVPDRVEPVPQTSFIGSPAAARPASAAFRSSVNVIAVASPDDAASWLSVNSRVTVPPGRTGSSVNDLVIPGAATTASVSLAGLPCCVVPSTVAVIADVVFR